MPKFLLPLLLLFATQIFAQQQTGAPLLIGRVAANQNSIAFNYAGKIWLVDRQGGAARRLNDVPAESNPVFSPDGKQLAFSRWNGSDYDVYVSSSTGGEAKRLTYMGEDDMAVAWMPDGKAVVFESTRDEEGLTRLFKIAVAGGTEEGLPLPQAFQGSFSPDGTKIAYNPRLAFSEWRYYRGGATAPIYITDLKTNATEKLPNQNFNDKSAMWLGDKIYFVSDRTGIFNLFVYDRKTKQTQQLTKFDMQGIRTAAAANDAIVFVQNGRIHLYDLATNQDKTVNVSVAPDTSELLPRKVNALRFLEQILPSAHGDKIVLGSRGEVVTVDAASGDSKNLTNTSGVAERYPTISPDNKSVAYFSDESGEYRLYVRSLENNAVKKIAVEKQPSFYWNLSWSPDSKKLVFAGKNLNLWMADVASGTAWIVAKSDYSAQSEWSPSFSPDSKFLAYSKRLKNRVGTIFIYDTAQKKSFQITDGINHTELPVFDANGKYLYFVSSPNAGTSEFEWGVLNGIFSRSSIIRRVHAFVLTKEAPPMFLPNNQPNPDAKVSEAASNVRIDFDNPEKRFINMPLPRRDYSKLLAGKAGKLFLAVGEWSKTPGDFNAQQQSSVIYLFDIAKAGEMQKIVEDVRGFDLTADGSKLLYGKGRDWFLVNSETAPKADEGKLNLSKTEISVNPSEEWRQMFHESVRIMRDWFYDPNYHGQNLARLEHEFAAYLPTTTRRGDLNALIRQMLGSVSVSHLGVGGGDTTPAQGKGNNIGLLGADYAIENGKYRFKKIYRTNSFVAANGSFNAPLDQANVDVREGDYLLEVGGQKIETDRNLFSYFENTINKPTKITVSASADGSQPRTYTVYPANGENRLRRANWAENNRKLVEKLSDGKLGYVFIEEYGGDGIMNAIRGLNGYSDKAGIIVDQRFNGGGITPDYLIEWMQRKPLYYYQFRGGDDIATPVNPAPPVKVMLINEWNGSAAETGAFMFKLGKVGSIVGKRTYGAGIGPYFFAPRLVDGGGVQLPNRAAYNPNGTWGVENFGVEPDFDVEITPQDWTAHKDSQLEKAVEVAMAQIAKNPVIQPKHPAFPVHPGNDKKDVSAVISQPSSFALPGSAFPAPAPKAEVKPVTNGKFAEFLGRFDTPMGVITFSQEGEKLIGLANNERIELFPDQTAKDKFSAQGGNVTVTFERDAASGKVIGATIVLPNGRELKGKLIN